jgi:hypothetical protein
MSAWIRATVDNRDETIYLNLDLAVRIERPLHRNYTAIHFVSSAGSQPAVKETPEELLAQLKHLHRAASSIGETAPQSRGGG